MKRTPKDGFVLILCQVDDFSVSGSSTEECDKAGQTIQKHTQNELHDLGIIKRFNGLDILQTRAHVKLSCELCIDKINTHHGWENEKAADGPVPVRNDAACQLHWNSPQHQKLKKNNESWKRLWDSAIDKPSEN
jgi:hypothetical protein